MDEFSGFFGPERVAVVGATPREDSIGRSVTANLLADFEDEVVPVYPNHEAVLEQACVPSVEEAGDVDLVVIDVPAAVAAEVLREAASASRLPPSVSIFFPAGFPSTGVKSPAEADDDEDGKNETLDRIIDFLATYLP